MRIRFVKKFAGRNPGHVEDNPDDHLCRGWLDKGVVERVDEPKPTSHRSVDKPDRDRALKSKRG